MTSARTWMVLAAAAVSLAGAVRAGGAVAEMSAAARSKEAPLTNDASSRPLSPTPRMRPLWP